MRRKVAPKKAPGIGVNSPIRKKQRMQNGNVSQLGTKSRSVGRPRKQIQPKEEVAVTVENHTRRAPSRLAALKSYNNSLNKVGKRRGRPPKSATSVNGQVNLKNDTNNVDGAAETDGNSSTHRKITLKIRRDGSVMKMVDVGVGDYMMVRTVDRGVGDGIVDPNWVAPPSVITTEETTADLESFGGKCSGVKDVLTTPVKELSPPATPQPPKRRGRRPKTSASSLNYPSKKTPATKSVTKKPKTSVAKRKRSWKVEDRSDTESEEDSASKSDSEQKVKYKQAVEKWDCEICGRSYRKYYMPYHMRTHTKERPYNCEKCGKSFAALYYYKEHKMQCIENPAAFQCNICHRNMATKHCLDEHLRTHSTECRFQCHICAKGFKQYANLTNHLKTHSDQRPFSCDICGKTYRYKKSVEMHKTRFHQGIRVRYPCDRCDKTFVCKTLLKDHINRHLGFSRHKCEYCGKRFSTRKIFLVHLLIHQDKKPFPCTVCGKEFRQRVVLKRHMTTHTGVKPFRCDACGKQFIHRVYLVRHKCPKAAVGSANDLEPLQGSLSNGTTRTHVPDEASAMNIYGDPMVDHVMLDPYAAQHDVLHPPYLLN